MASGPDAGPHLHHASGRHRSCQTRLPQLHGRDRRRDRRSSDTGGTDGLRSRRRCTRPDASGPPHSLPACSHAGSALMEGAYAHALSRRRCHAAATWRGWKVAALRSIHRAIPAHTGAGVSTPSRAIRQCSGPPRPPRAGTSPAALARAASPSPPPSGAGLPVSEAHPSLPNTLTLPPTELPPGPPTLREVSDARHPCPVARPPLSGALPPTPRAPPPPSRAFPPSPDARPPPSGAFPPTSGAFHSTSPS